MKNIIAIGVSHKTTPIAIREKFFLNEVQKKLLLSELRSECSVTEALILSTCNRTEIFAHVLDKDRDFPLLFKKLFELKELPQDKFKKYFYSFEAEAAVYHLLRVATGLESMVLGERQVLGQVKDAVELSREKGMLGTRFNILTNSAIRTGKKAQNETDISLGGMSVSWAAVRMAEKLLGTLEGKSVLIMGAGEMSELAGNLLKGKNTSKIYVMNRTQENASEIAKSFGGIPVGFWDIKEILSEIDVGICAVDAPHYILEKETVKKTVSLRDKRRLFLIDISIPRNIDPKVNKIEGVQLVHIDELDKVVEENLLRRKQAIISVEAIIQSKFSEYCAKIEKIETYRELESLEI